MTLHTLALLAGIDEFVRSAIASLGWPAEGVVRLLLAVCCGGLIGFEREVRVRQAGFRTLILVSLGSALAMIISIRLAAVDWPHQPGNVVVSVDPGRIAYGIMTGVGFLGAGTIIERGGKARGLTTAAAIWCVAAIGMSMGFGLYVLGFAATLLVLAALWILDYFELIIPVRRVRTVTVRVPYHPRVIHDVRAKFAAFNLSVEESAMRRTEGNDAYCDVELRLVYNNADDYDAFEAKLAETGGLEVRASREL